MLEVPPALFTKRKPKVCVMKIAYKTPVCEHYLCTCECCGISLSGEAANKGAVVIDPGAIHLLTICHKYPASGHQPCFAGPSQPAVIDLGPVSMHAARVQHGAAELATTSHTAEQGQSIASDSVHAILHSVGKRTSHQQPCKMSMLQHTVMTAKSACWQYMHISLPYTGEEIDEEANDVQQLSQV